MIRKLIAVSKKLHSGGALKQKKHLLILRSDYMVDCETGDLKMVEYNTIAASFGNLSERIRKNQIDLMEKYQDFF